MRTGGGKQKGSQFERDTCKALSLWVSGGKQTDLFWRSAMSGGRATVQHRKGVMVRQAGDICAVAPEGQEFCERWYIECKHVRKLGLDQFLVKGTGPLAVFWKKTMEEANRHLRCPMLIARQNGWPTLVMALGFRTAFKAAFKWTIINPICDICRFDDMVASPYDPRIGYD